MILNVSFHKLLADLNFLFCCLHCIVYP